MHATHRSKRNLIDQIATRIHTRLSKITTTLLRGIRVNTINIIRRGKRTINITSHQRPHSILRGTRVIQTNGMSTRKHTTLNKRLIRHEERHFQLRETNTRHPNNVQHKPRPLSIRIRRDHHMRRNLINIPHHRRSEATYLYKPRLRHGIRRNPSTLTTTLNTMVNTNNTRRLHHINLTLDSSTLNFMRLIYTHGFNSIRLFATRQTTTLITQRVRPNNTLLNMTASGVSSEDIRNFVHELHHLHEHYEYHPTQ